MIIGRTIQVNDELSFKCPDYDKKEASEILFRNKAKKDQYWTLVPESGTPVNPGPHTHVVLDIPKIYFDWHIDVLENQEFTEYNEAGELISLSVEDTQLVAYYLTRELRRRQKGIRFMNDGDVEYITGDNYFFLVYKNMPLAPGNRAQFRKFQRDVFYVIELALNDENVLGAFFAKAKKTGLSEIIASVILNHSTMIRQRSFGVMNKSQDEANDVNINMIWTSYELLPNILQPSVKSKNLSKIKFGNPSITFTGTEQNRQKIARLKKTKPLNTWIYSGATKKEVKFDGPVMYIVHLDELPKYKVSPKAIFNKVSETVKLQQTIIGKIFITSYPPEEDSKFMVEAQEIYYNSKKKTAIGHPLGRTTSGLICHFVSALDATDGTFDIYGNADKAKAFMLNDAERKACKTEKDRQAKIRQYPRNEIECWTSGASGSTFDNEHLKKSLENIEAMERGDIVLSTDLNLEWENGVEYGRVSFDVVTEEESKEGKLAWWNFTEMPDLADCNRCYRDENGLWTPPMDSKHIGGVDPTEYKNSGAGEVGATNDPSDAAMVFMSFPDASRDLMMNRPASNVIVCEYCGRRDDPEEFLKDVIKTMFFLSCYVIIEANKQWLVTRLVNMGFRNFLLLKQNDGTIKPYKFGEANKAITTTTKVIDEYCRDIDIYLKKPKLPGEVDYCMQLKSKRLILQLTKFKPTKTKEFDLVVALGYCLMAKNSFSAILQYIKANTPEDDLLVATAYAILDGE